MAKVLRKIKELPANPAGAAVYKRGTGDIFVRLNDEFHVKGKIEQGRVLGDGTAEALDPEEVVEVIRP